VILLPLSGPGDQKEGSLPIRPVFCLTDIQPAQLRVIYPKEVTTQSHLYSAVCFKLREILGTWEAEIGKIWPQSQPGKNDCKNLISTND
jgi:hypothetical protein